MTDTSAQFVAEIVAYDRNIGTTRTLYFASRGFSSKSTDTPDHTHFDGVIDQASRIERTMFAQRATKGRSTRTVGDLVLMNDGGEWDRMSFYAFDGRAITIRRGPVGGAYPGDFTTDLVATMQAAEMGQRSITIKIRDRQAVVSVPVQTTKYTGGGLGTLEGVAGDLKGKPKPVLFGKVENIAPPCVETAKLIYQVHDGATVAINAVYDQANALTDAGSTYADVAALLASGPSAGQFKVYSGSEGTYLRLGAAPNGQVTCDATEGSAASDRTVAQVYKRMLTRAGLSAGDWNATDLTDLDSAANYVIGIWLSHLEEREYADCFDEIASSVGAAWFVDRANDFRIKQLLSPTGSPVLSFTEDDMLRPPGLVRVVTNDPGRGIPTYKTIVRYRKFYAVQETDIAAAVTQDRRELVSKPFREAVSTDATVQTSHLLAPQDVDDSLLTSESDAQAEATRRQTLRGVQRDFYEFVVKLDDDTAALELNDVIEVHHPRYHIGVVGDPDQGALFRVLGLATDAKARTLTITAWGATQNVSNRITQDATLTYRVTQTGQYRVTQAAALLLAVALRFLTLVVLVLALGVVGGPPSRGEPISHPLPEPLGEWAPRRTLSGHEHDLTLHSGEMQP